MRFLAVAVLLVSGVSVAEAPRIYRKADGSVCVLTVEAGKLSETCEAAVRPAAAVTPDAPVVAARVELAPVVAQDMPVSAVALLGSASLKHGWSGGLKLSAISNGIAGLLYLNSPGYATAGAVSLSLAAVSLVAAVVLDFSAGSDIEAAGLVRR